MAQSLTLPADLSLAIDDDDKKATYVKIQQWLGQCLQKHNDCGFGNEEILPKRVIDVKTLQLLTPESQQGQYITLSHCWGTTHGVEPPKTLHSNLTERKLGIPWHELTQTYQDAICIARHLDISYIWIDSLCIIQDDEGDWNEQSVLMKQIYSRSYLTISATHAASGRDGCFTKTRRIEDGDETQNACDHGAFSFTQDYGRRCPLLLRGWAYQERLLSTRVLHFGPDEMIWECQTDFWCECQRNRDAFRFRNKQQSHLDHELSWQQFVISYTACSITYDADKLTAFAGVAEYLSTANNGFLGVYYAGLWQKHLNNPAWLCWYAPAAGQRPGTYIAPSWSWASVKDCTVQVPLTDAILRTHATVRGLDCTLSTPSPYGAVSAGYMKLEGGLVPFPRTLTAKHQYFADTQDIEGMEDKETLYCAPIYDSERSEEQGECFTKHLVLCSTEESATYRRVGVLVERGYVARRYLLTGSMYMWIK